MNQFAEILSILGYLIRALGFIVLGFGVGRFTMDAYQKAVWQLGFFGLLVGLTNYASAGSMGMFALSAGIAIILSGRTKMENTEEEAIKE
jgi:hypothetical protein